MDFIHFGISFAGFVSAVGGVVVASIPTAIGGLALMLLGLAYFSVNDAGSD